MLFFSGLQLKELHKAATHILVELCYYLKHDLNIVKNLQ